MYSPVECILQPEQISSVYKKSGRKINEEIHSAPLFAFSHFIVYNFPCPKKKVKNYKFRFNTFDE